MDNYYEYIRKNMTYGYHKDMPDFNHAMQKGQKLYEDAKKKGEDHPFREAFNYACNDLSLRVKWFQWGRESVLRKNDSGCSCKLDGAHQIVSACDIHTRWAETMLGKKL